MLHSFVRQTVVDFDSFLTPLFRKSRKTRLNSMDHNVLHLFLNIYLQNQNVLKPNPYPAKPYFRPYLLKCKNLFLMIFLVDLRVGRHLLTSQHSLPGNPVAKHSHIDLRTSMDGKYKEIAEVNKAGISTIMLLECIFLFLLLCKCVLNVCV